MVSPVVDNRAPLNNTHKQPTVVFRLT
jgi:hypothetical protein